MRLLISAIRPDILASPIVGMTHAVVMLAFILLIAFYVAATVLRGSRRGRIAAGQAESL